MKHLINEMAQTINKLKANDNTLFNNYLGDLLHDGYAIRYWITNELSQYFWEIRKDGGTFLQTVASKSDAIELAAIRYSEGAYKCYYLQAFLPVSTLYETEGILEELKPTPTAIPNLLPVP